MYELEKLIKNGEAYWFAEPVPIEKATIISITAGDKKITIRWTDPADTADVSFVKSVLVRSTAHIPTSINDGTIIVESSIRNQYSSGYTDTGLTNNTTYYYNVFELGDNDIYTAGDGGSAKPVPQMEFLLVAGGGGGGGGYYGGGGGGGGGVIYCTTFTVASGSYNVVIGAGGTVSGYSNVGGNGCNSCFGTIVACGGGGGGAYSNGGAGCNGGSGGGAGYNGQAGTKAGGTAVSGQGYAGASTTYSTSTGYSRGGGGGGGGKGGSGGYGTTYDYWCGTGGNGGAGYSSNISGSTQYYGAGGGGGGIYCAGGNGGSGVGGVGGGNGVRATAATYYGGGGGGGGYNGSPNYYPGAGCQGVFIVRYPSSCGYIMTGGTKYLCNGYCIHCFTSNGTLTIN